ncbi:hypothetical protein IKQ21_08280 [bacterium]|nr:hypothetical protein [bacterium]
MTDGIGRLSGYGNYGVGGYVPQRKGGEDANQAEEQQIVNNYEDTQVDPSKVMDFLANNNFFINQANAPAPVEGVVTDPAVADRVAWYMENFETIFAIIEQEFGAELAPSVMDFAMDHLMGMVE